MQESKRELDDAGCVTITSAAKKALAQVLKENPGKAVRVRVDGFG